MHSHGAEVLLAVFVSFGIVGLTAYAFLMLGLRRPDYAETMFVLMASREIFFFILFMIEMIQGKIELYI